MNKTVLAIVVCFLLVSVTFLIKPTLWGADTFHYWSVECFGKQYTTTHSPLFKIIIDFLGCNLLVWKALSIVFLLFSIITLYLIAKRFNVLNPWLAGLFLFMAPGFVSTLFRFEPETLSIPFILLGLFLFYSNQKPAAILIWLIGSAIWPGTLIFVTGMAILYWPLILLPLIGFLLIQPSIPGIFFPNPLVGENGFLAGISILGALVFSFYRLQEKKELFYPAIIFFVLGLLNAKWMFFAVPFLALNLSIVFTDAKNFFGVPFGQLLKFILPGMVLVTMLLLFSYYPSNAESNGISYALSLNKNVQNSWGLGNYIAGFGGTPSKQFGPSFESPICDNRPVITIEDLNKPFVLINQFDYIKIYSCK